VVSKEFKAALADRCEGWEIAEFLQIPAEELIEAFEDDVEVNYDDLAEWIGLRGKGDNTFDEDDTDQPQLYDFDASA